MTKPVPAPLQSATASPAGVSSCTSAGNAATIFWLQGVTLLWMVAECALSLYAAASAHSPVLLAFGSDSLVEVLSAAAVLAQFLPRYSLSEERAARIAGALLVLLALIVGITASASLALRLRPASSRLGIAVTVAALVAMPVLARLKRREARRRNNPALAADAAQSAMCAYLALIALAGLAVNSVFHIAWFDPLAALAAVPLLFAEGKRAWQGRSCNCC